MIQGSCLCRNVKYEISGDGESMYYCHCKMCRRASGSSFATNMLMNVDDLVIKSGEAYIKGYESSPGETRYFCSECGSGLPFLNESGNTLFIPAGSLDSDLEIKPDSNIFWGDKS